MNVSEKLVGLVKRAIIDWEHGDASEWIVDHLIANGVMVQKYTYLETVVEVKDNTVCRSRVSNEISQLTKKIVGLKNV